MSSITSFREEFYNAVFTSSSLVKREEQGLENLDTQLVILNKECCRYRSMFQRACRSGDSATIEICRKVSLIFRELKYNLGAPNYTLLVQSIVCNQKAPVSSRGFTTCGPAS